MHSLACISWNIHRGRCNDGRLDPDRMLHVLAREVWQAEADALILQEADAEAAPHHGVLDTAAVAAATGLRYLHADPASRLTPQSHGFLGVVVYLHPEIEVHAVALLDLPGLCPRGAVVVDLQKAGIRLRLVATHLSLSQALRVVQLRTIGQHLDRLDHRQTILCGDLNEWRPWGGLALSQPVLGRSFSGPALRSFPAGRPLLPLDRILTTAPGVVMQAKVLDGPGIRAASDHRPLFAHISVARISIARVSIG